MFESDSESEGIADVTAIEYDGDVDDGSENECSTSDGDDSYLSDDFEFESISEELDGNTPNVCVTQPPTTANIKGTCRCRFEKATHRLHL